MTPILREMKKESSESNSPFPKFWRNKHNTYKKRSDFFLKSVKKYNFGLLYKMGFNIHSNI